MKRYLTLIWVQARASISMAMQYRVNFMVQGGMSLLWLAGTLIPLLVLYERRETVAGWTFDEALMVMAWFTMLRAFLEGAVNPSLVDVVDRIRTGAFDYLLLKPADTQFLVSTVRFEPWKVVDIAAAGGLMIYSLIAVGHAPSAADFALGFGLLIAALAVLYSLSIIVVSTSFWVVRVDNLAYLFSAIFDAGRWPVQVFRGFWRVLFTFVIPLAVMTTYPAMALLGKLELAVAGYALAGALLLGLLARRVWRASIGAYTSASS